jgi:hypothetical protein
MFFVVGGQNLPSTTNAAKHSEDLNTLCSNGDLDQLQDLFSYKPNPSHHELDKALQMVVQASSIAAKDPI